MNCISRFQRDFIHQGSFFLFFFVFALLCFSGITSYEVHSAYYSRYNYLPSNSILELCLVVLCILNQNKKPSRQIWFVGWVGLGFVLISFLMFLIRRDFYDSNIFDFVIIYKVFLYIILLINVRKDFFSVHHLQVFFKFLVSFFFIKYLLSRFIFGINRPGIFVENNFELLLLISVFFLHVYHGLYLERFYKGAFFLVILLSGSRSGLVCTLFSYAMLILFKLDKKLLLKMLVFFILGAFSVVVFYQRLAGGDIHSIDRFVFLNIFLQEIRDFSFYNYLFGADIITSLSDGACSQLSFYSSMFSTSDSKNCFSVVLHSFVLRSFFDHGLVGFFLVLISFYYILTKSGYSKYFSFVIVLMFVLNGLSVSSFNSVYAGFSFFIFVSSSFFVLNKSRYE